ncbi:MAG: hypothetical protein CAF41_015545 [Nitrospira sp. CG24A]|nr:MAG: hypothetical protein CAF41_015545 [Nitrospira sp. CG24A]
MNAIPPVDLARTLTTALQLTVPPVAMAFVDSVPAGVSTFDGQVPAGCRLWQEATSHVFATVARDHEMCSIGVYTHNLERSAGVQTDLQDTLKVLGDLTYVRPEDMPFIPVLKREAKVVLYGPLESIPVAPDVVLLFVKSDQALILSEASQQLEQGVPPALGRPACAVIPQAINTGRTALSLGCCGARAYLDLLTPDMALYAIPAATLVAFTARVEALAKANYILTKFHAIRRRESEAGNHPTVKESLSALSAG